LTSFRSKLAKPHSAPKVATSERASIWELRRGTSVGQRTCNAANISERRNRNFRNSAKAKSSISESVKHEFHVTR
jgi:hypothetical protein